MIDQAKCPDLLGFTGLAHALNMTAGWYGNACGCANNADQKSKATAMAATAYVAANIPASVATAAAMR